MPRRKPSIAFWVVGMWEWEEEVGGLSTRLLARKLATIVAKPQNGNHKKFYENF